MTLATATGVLATPPRETPAWRRCRPGVLVLVTGSPLHGAAKHPGRLRLMAIAGTRHVVLGRWRSVRGGVIVAVALDRIAPGEGWFTVACTQLSGNAVGTMVPAAAPRRLPFCHHLRHAGGCGAATASLAASSSLQLERTAPAGDRGARSWRALPSLEAGTSAYLGAVVLALLVLGGVLAFAVGRLWPTRTRSVGLERNRPPSGRSRAFPISSIGRDFVRGRSAAGGRPR